MFPEVEELSEDVLADQKSKRSNKVEAVDGEAPAPPPPRHEEMKRGAQHFASVSSRLDAQDAALASLKQQLDRVLQVLGENDQGGTRQGML